MGSRNRPGSSAAAALAVLLTAALSGGCSAALSTKVSPTAMREFSAQIGLHDEALALQRLYHWERTAPDRGVLTQPMGGGAGQDFTWREVLDQTRRLAAHLRGLGLRADLARRVAPARAARRENVRARAGGRFGQGARIPRSAAGARAFPRRLSTIESARTPGRWN